MGRKTGAMTMKRETHAPGLLRVRRSSEREEWWWSASRACKRLEAKAFRPRTVRLRQSTEEERAARCRDLTSELLQWLADEGRAPRAMQFDGTVRSLNTIHEKHPDSPFHAASYATRQVYCREVNPLLKAVGERRVDRVTGADLRRWHASFAAPGKAKAQPRLRRAQGAMKALRRIVSWGVQLRLPGCADLRVILREARFTMPAPRESAPTSLRQTDCIGRWEPVDQVEGQGGYLHAGRRWSGGLLWQDIRDGVLAKRTTKTGAPIKFAIAALPLVIAEIANVPEEKRIGPMVVDEATDRPYRHRWFATIWRRIARKAGIPDSVWSRDTRAAAITEAFDAGAQLEHVRQMATHSDPKVTGRYNRGSAAQTSAVAALRVSHRAKETK